MLYHTGMKSNRKKDILDRMAQIERMERGKICKMAGREHYNHQTWLNGRNVVRYVSAEQLDCLQEAIDGYKLFMKLAQKYADEVVKQTRAAAAKNKTCKRRRNKNT